MLSKIDKFIYIYFECQSKMLLINGVVYGRKMVSKLSDKGCKITLDGKMTSVLIQFRVLVDYASGSTLNKFLLNIFLSIFLAWMSNSI